MNKEQKEMLVNDLDMTLDDYLKTYDETKSMLYLLVVMGNLTQDAYDFFDAKFSIMLRKTRHINEIANKLLNNKGITRECLSNTND